MVERPSGSDPTSPPLDGSDPVEMAHPRGTLAIVALYGLLLAVGWIAMYFAFLERGVPR
jgi:hypothetical protein